jgi:uncharacterized OB-fold protein
MDGLTELRLVADGLVAGTPEAPRLIGSRCERCGVVTFPAQGSCPACMSLDTKQHLLAPRGTLWTWTIQCFPPKSPPYASGDGEFEPYGVGYVDLGGEVRVEGRLTEADAGCLRIGMPMETALIEAPGGGLTYAFAPLEEDAG